MMEQARTQPLERQLQLVNSFFNRRMLYALGPTSRPCSASTAKGCG